MATATQGRTQCRQAVDACVRHLRRLGLPDDLQRRVRLWLNHTWDQKKTLGTPLSILFRCSPSANSNELRVSGFLLNAQTNANNPLSVVDVKKAPSPKCRLGLEPGFSPVLVRRFVALSCVVYYSSLLMAVTTLWNEWQLVYLIATKCHCVPEAIYSHLQSALVQSFFCFFPSRRKLHPGHSP